MRIRVDDCSNGPAVYGGLVLERKIDWIYGEDCPRDKLAWHEGFREQVSTHGLGLVSSA